MEKIQLKDDTFIFNNFISEEDSDRLAEYLEKKDGWTQVAFYESYGMNMIEDDCDLNDVGLESDYLKKLAIRMHEAVEDAHERKVKKVSTHAQKWEEGANAPYHSDNSDMEGNPSAWEKSKLVCILYLNDNFDGGEIEFRDWDIIIKPRKGLLLTFPGGIKNVHKVNEVSNGCRYTFGAFWDYYESEYTQERMDEWEQEISEAREVQKKMFEEWRKEKESAIIIQ